MKNFWNRFIIDNKERQTRLLLLAALFASCLWIFRDYVFGEQLLIFNDIGSDTLQQYDPQFISIIRHLKEGNFALWDFTNGFGVNQFNVNLFDPSLMLLYFLGTLVGTAKILYFLVFIQILRIMAAGWSFYLFVSCFSYSRKSRFAAAFSYGLCSYLMVWGQHYQFGMAVVYLPLLLLFAEKYLQKKKAGYFLPVMVMISCLYSAFFSYMSLLTVGIYLVIRLLMTEGLNFRQRLKILIGGGLRILLGIGMSMAVFLPMALCLLNISGRVAENNAETTSWIQNYFVPFAPKFYQSELMRLFSSNLQNTHGLKDGLFEAYANYYEDPVLYTSVLTIFLDLQFLPMYFRKEKERRRRIGISMAAVLIVGAVIFPAVGTIYNAFSYYASRFVYVLVPFLILGFLWVFREIEQGEALNRTLLLVTGGIMTAVYGIGYQQSIFGSARRNALVLMLCGLGCLLLLWIGQKKTAEKTSGKMSEKSSGRDKRLVLLLILMMVSVVSDGEAGYADRIALRKADTPPEMLTKMQEQYDEDSRSEDPYRVAQASLQIPQGYFTALQSVNMQEVLEYLREKDPEFFRMEKDFTGMTDYMDSMLYGYYGVSSYNTVFNKYLKDFMKTCYPDLFHQGETYHMTFQDCAEDSDMAAFFGVRYWVSRSSELNPEKYEMLQQFGDLYLYRNRLESSMARVYTRAVSEKEFRERFDSEDRKNFLMNTIALPEEELESYEENSEPAEPGDSRVTLERPEKDSLVRGSVHAEQDGYLLFMIPYEDGWELRLDGEKTELLRGDLGFLACRTAAGDHTIELRFTAPGLSAGWKLSIVFCGIYVLWLLAALKKSGKGKSQKV